MCVGKKPPSLRVVASVRLGFESCVAKTFILLSSNPEPFLIGIE